MQGFIWSPVLSMKVLSMKLLNKILLTILSLALLIIALLVLIEHTRILIQHLGKDRLRAAELTYRDERITLDLPGQAYIEMYYLHDYIIDKNYAVETLFSKSDTQEVGLFEDELFAVVFGLDENISSQIYTMDTSVDLLGNDAIRIVRKHLLAETVGYQKLGFQVIFGADNVSFTPENRSVTFGECSSKILTNNTNTEFYLDGNALVITLPIEANKNSYETELIITYQCSNNVE